MAAECLIGLAAALAGRGETVEAARLYGAGEALRESIGAMPSDSETAIAQRFVPLVEEALGKEQFEEASAAGRAIPADEAVDAGLRAVAGGDRAPVP